MFDKISQALQAGASDKVVELVGQALEGGKSAEDILNKGLIKGMSVIGKQFKEGEIFIPEVLIAARAMNNGIERLEPELLKNGVKSKGKLLIGTVKDDLHDIGKNLVSIMFKGSGFEVVDLGTNVNAEKFVEAAQEHKPEVIGLSALLTTTMVNMESIVQSLKEAGIEAYIMIGGAPVTAEFARSIQAEYAENAVEGVDKALAVLSN